MSRIAIGGFQHETNTFAPSKADYAAFEAGGGWPGAQYGEPIFGAVEGANIPAAGAIQALRALGHAMVGTAWAAASPSAHVTADAFERILNGLMENLKDAGRVDGVYLDLHGAMVSEEHEDGEGEILRRVRELVGPRVPIVASLDLHANVTRAMIEHGRRDGGLPHLPARRHGRHRRARRAPARPDAEDRAAHVRRLPHPRLPDRHFLAVLVHRAVQGHLCRAGQAGREIRLHAVVHAGLPDGRFRGMRHVGLRLRPRRRQDAAGRRAACAASSPMPKRISSLELHARRRRGEAARAIAANRASRSCSPTRRTIPAPAATATRRAC